MMGLFLGWTHLHFKTLIIISDFGEIPHDGTTEEEESKRGKTQLHSKINSSITDSYFKA